jgi:hypothetical protein
MAIPPFESNGNLPIGIHTASLNEVRTRFGSSNATRQSLFVRLDRIFQIAQATGCLAHFVVFGSFVTDEDFPNDVDVFLLMADNFDVSVVAGEAQILFDHLKADAYYGCSVFWMRCFATIGGERAAMEHWQICRDGSLRGIVEIVL